MQVLAKQFLIVGGLVAGALALPASAAETPSPDLAPAKRVTFNRDIAPLVFEHCAVCHRPGEVAPFSLLSFADVQKRAKQIETVTARDFMPPWKGVAGHGSFIGERRLSPEQRARIAEWVAQGTPEGEPGDLPPTPKFREGWKLGEPDLVLTMPQPYEVPADGADIYRNFVFTVQVPPGKYIKAAEYRPGNRQVVHHAALSVDASAKSRTQDADDPAPGFQGSLNIPGRMLPGSLGSWTPGRDPLPLPEGYSMPWPSGADLILQLHLHPSGKVEREQSSVGLYFTEEPPQRSMIDLLLIHRKIDIPAGERTYRTRDELTLPIEMEAFGLFPHMHIIGREIKITAQPPEGEPFSLLWINDWDFNWQNFYQFAAPVKLPAGTRLVLEAVHDNSAENARNPSQPPRRVTWGEQTTNEMSVAILQLVPAQESELPQIAGPYRRRIIGGITAAAADRKEPPPAAEKDPAAAAQGALKKFDADRDNRLNLDEIVVATKRDKAEVRQQLVRFDADQDGALNATELEAAIRILKSPAAPQP
jgi:mono/diheme cytochrome c family protein